VALSSEKSRKVAFFFLDKNNEKSFIEDDSK
jgi:hypothetical protein